MKETPVKVEDALNALNETISTTSFGFADLTVLNEIFKYARAKWEASALGYVNQGGDPRLLGRWGAFVQHLLSFRPKVFKPNPYSILFKDAIWFVGSPPYVVCNVPLGDGHYQHYRIGWRYDVNWTETGGYIFSIARKVLDRAMIYK